MAPSLRILALDGGGVRGKSVLLILEAIMEKVRDALGQETTPLPCEYFDIIGGTSTGGLIAIMLGRLGMSIGQCIEAYDTLAAKAFKEKSGLKLPGSPSGSFSATALKEALITAIEKNCNESGSGALFRNHQCCKTVVLAITKDNVNTLPTLFKSYDTSDSLKDCKIWEVGRATSAATTFFKSIICGRDNIEFVDAAFGYNNPCAVLIREAQTTHPGREFSCILSIGTGLGGVVSIEDKRLAILNSLKKMASSSKRVADELADTWPDNVYYRFNVTNGMEDISLSDTAKLSKISAHTRNYLRDTQKQLLACSIALQMTPREPQNKVILTTAVGEDISTMSLQGVKATHKLKYIDQEVAKVSKTGIRMPYQSKSDNGLSNAIFEKPDVEFGDWIDSATNYHAVSERTTKTPFFIPFDQDKNFVGREDIINSISSLLETKSRVALTGVGGIGKSQIAIEYCYRYRETHPVHPILWVFASTAKRFEQAYQDIARRLKLPGWDDPSIDTLRLVSEWLTDGNHDGWLMILDNADDEDVFFNLQSNVDRYSTPLISYLPPTSKGSMIITSRNRMTAFRLTNVADAIVDISPMKRDDAEILLKRKLPDDRSSASEINDLLTMLEYLPLAITQAAAYIAIRQTRFTISKYLAQLRQNETILLKDMGDLRRDYEVPNSILKTWQISFNQIKSHYPQSADLLSLMSVLSRQGIPQSLICRDKEISEIKDALDTLHNFLLITREREDGIFGMHRLVQLAMKTWLASHNEINKWENEALRLLTLSFSWEVGYEQRWYMLLPHAEVVSEYIYHDQTELLRLATLSTQMTMYFQLQGKYKAALKSIQRAVNIHQLLKMEDSALIESLLFQALVFRELGRYDEAETISRKVLESHESHESLESPLGNDKRIELRVLSNLASALEGQGKYEEAELLYQLVVEAAKKDLGERNVWTLTYMNNLALVLQRRGKYTTAEDMHRQELELSKKIYGEKNQHTLKSMGNLAIALKAQGKLDEAEDLQKAILKLGKNTLGDEHPLTLTMQTNLAITLKARGQYPECAEMHQQVLPLREKVLGNEHPDTIQSRKGVAVALKDSGQHDSAEKMLRTVLQQEERVLGKEHPYTLNTMYLLAHLLSLRKQYHNASILYQRALVDRQKVLGPDHPDTKQCLQSHEELLAEMKSQELD